MVKTPASNARGPRFKLQASHCTWLEDWKACCHHGRCLALWDLCSIYSCYCGGGGGGGGDGVLFGFFFLCFVSGCQFILTG